LIKLVTVDWWGLRSVPFGSLSHKQVEELSLSLSFARLGLFEELALNESEDEGKIIHGLDKVRLHRMIDPSSLPEITR
jgi:hypothetical protein